MSKKLEELLALQIRVNLEILEINLLNANGKYSKIETNKQLEKHYKKLWEIEEKNNE